MIYLDISTIYRKKFRRGLTISNGPFCRYYSFLTKLVIIKMFYPLDGYQELVCVSINDY